LITPRFRTLAAVSLLLAACATAPVAPPAATATPIGAATSPPPATATAAASLTPPAVTASPTVGLTATPGPTALGPAATLTPAASDASQPAAPAIDPLTGLAVASPDVLNRRPLALKIAEFPRRVRPQFGLSLADNVWEHYAEGGVTRLTAIFLSQGADKLGNIRSARLIDAILGQAYQAMLVAAGSSDGVMDRLRHTDFFNRFVAEETGYRTCPILCREESGAVTTDKLFTSAPALWDLETKLGLSGRQDLSGFTFDPQPPAGGQDAPTVHLDFQLGNNVVEWRYDAAAGAYARWVDSSHLPDLDPHLDADTGKQIMAANVVVLFVPYHVTNLIENEAGHLLSYDILLTGSGPARLFRDGQLYQAQWTRASTGLPRLVDASGQPLPFRPGPIWFELVTPDSPNSFQGGLFTLRFSAPNALATQQPAPTPTP
jgi:Protein of unknown function (DUF3048) N-terminal domain/Protein of unknown function (DUF3048) C-terminal domain